MNNSRQSEPGRFLTATAKGPRDEQQDAVLCLSDPEQTRAFLVVSDGVGGNTGGGLASLSVIESARIFWDEQKGKFSNPKSALATVCELSHKKIREVGDKQAHSARATIVALYLTSTEAHWVHSGDSRLYHFRNRQLVERTEDHSVVQILVNQGKLDEKEMGSHPSQGVLLQCLGGDEYPPPAFGKAEVTADDAFLLCTDGFWERTSTKEMVQTVFCLRSESSDYLERAVERAVERNGPKGDNVTVAVALPIAEKSPDSTKKGSTRRPILWVALVLLALCALLILLLHWHP